MRYLNMNRGVRPPHVRTRRSSLAFAVCSIAGIMTYAAAPAFAWQFREVNPGVARSRDANERDEAPAPFPADAVGPAAERASELPDIRASSFRELTPGESKVEDVLRMLGEPAEKAASEGVEVWSYPVSPLFSHVDIHLQDRAVQTIVFHLRTAMRVAEVEQELDLKSFVAATVLDEAGKTLGQAYPERGILLGFGTEQHAADVAQVVLEPLSADAFIHRVLQDAEHHFTRNQKDLDIAIRLQPRLAQPHWLRARLNEALGNYTAALVDAESASRLEPGNSQYRLTRAQLLYRTGDHHRAMKEVRSVISRNEDPEIESLAECLLGDFLAGGPSRDFKLAIEHHQAAAKIASGLASTGPANARRTANRILLDAYLGAANDIARGMWGNKDEAVPTWLKRADKLSRTMITDDGAEPVLLMDVRRRTLTALGRVRGDQDIDSVVEDLFDLGRELIADAKDPLYQHHLEWELVEGLAEAVAYEHERGNYESAKTYANNALALAETQLDVRPQSAERDHVIGSLYFYAGSIQALDQKNHHEAVRHFRKALQYLESPLRSDQLDDLGLHGERFVSMGVSFWEVKDRVQAVRITLQGLRWLEKAVQDGTMEKSALVVPYNNLASMYQATGKMEEAKAMSARARQVERR